MTDVWVTPPAANVWDVEDIVARALAVLRMDGTDVDAARVADAVDAALAALDQELDAVDPIDTTARPDLIQSAVERGIEEYRRKDAPFGVADAWSTDTVPVRISSDRRRSTRSLVLPHKQRFGMA